MRSDWTRRAVRRAVVPLVLLGCLGAAAPAGTAATSAASGIGYRVLSVRTPRGTVRAHLLTVDLSRRSLGLLWTGAVTRRATVPALAAARGALAAVNGDFFDISERQHPGVPATGAPVGPMVVRGWAVKAAVPQGQRFGQPDGRGPSDEDVFGLARNGRPELDRLVLRGWVRTPSAALPLRGLNQYAIPVGGIGAYTGAWGSVSRERAVCGTDRDRGAPCSRQTWAVTVRHGVVTRTSAAPGQGRIPAGMTVLVGREAGARRLRALRAGEHVTVHYALDALGGTVFRWALGGCPLVRDGAAAPGLDARTADPRTAVGVSRDGRRVWLLAVDGREASSTGLTLRELARQLVSLGAWQAVYVDGGGSTTMTLRGRVVNRPADGRLRPVPNAIGVF